VACVLIWGSTWLAITYQLGQVPPAVSVAYRFALAAAILLAYCGVRALPLHYTVRDLDQEVRLVKHGFIRDK